MSEHICYLFAYLAEAIIAWLYIDYLFQKKSSSLVLRLTFSAGYIILYFVGWAEIAVINVIVFFTVNCLLLLENYHCKIGSAIFHSAFMTSAMAITESIAALCISAFRFSFDAYANNLSVLIVMTVISKFVYFALTVVASVFFSRSKSNQEDPSLMGLLCSLPILSAGISAIVIYIGTYFEMSAPVKILMVTIVLTLLIVNLIFMVLYNHMQRLHADHLTWQLSLQKEEADTAYYQSLQEQTESQKILIHDIKDHLSTIDALARKHGAEEIIDYLAKLEKTLLPSHQSKMCSDPVLNLVLLQIKERCHKANIKFQCDVRENCATILDAPSVTTLYGNLLSNAIESAENSEDRIIELSVTRNEEQEIVIISVVNSCDIAPISDSHGWFRTRKQDPNIHGIGLKSIQRIVDRYDGVSTTYFDSENRRFHHIVQFSI